MLNKNSKPPSNGGDFLKKNLNNKF